MRATGLALSSIALFSLLLAGCGDPSSPEASSDAGAAEAEPRRGTWITADGVPLPYSVSGPASDTTVVFVHCWMCDATFWEAQVPAVAESYRVVTLDLPGHGEAGANRETWTVAGYGKDVAGLLDELDLENVVLVGHSMGGPVSLRTASLRPGRVRGIVAVDTLQDAEFSFDSDQMKGFLAAFRADFEGTCNMFVDGMFPETGPAAAEVKERVAEAGCSAENAEIGVALMTDFGTMDLAAWMSEAEVPIRAINAAMNPTLPETNRKYADFEHVEIEGVGHYLHMTRPEPFNAHLLEAIAELSGA